MTSSRRSPGSTPMSFTIHEDRPPRVLVMVSRPGHCLNDLIFRWRWGTLDGELVAVVSNHDDLRPMAAAAELPYRHRPRRPGRRTGCPDRGFSLEIGRTSKAERPLLLVPHQHHLLVANASLGWESHGAEVEQGLLENSAPRRSEVAGASAEQSPAPTSANRRGTGSTVSIGVAGCMRKKTSLRRSGARFEQQPLDVEPMPWLPEMPVDLVEGLLLGVVDGNVLVFHAGADRIVVATTNRPSA